MMKGLPTLPMARTTRARILLVTLGLLGATLVAAIVEPVLAPFRRLIPMIGGLDLSPLFALIAIQAVSMLLPIDRILGVMLCSPLSRSVF